LNVEEQCLNVIRTSGLREANQKTGYPIVHGWIFNVNNGELIDLDLDFHKILKEIQEF